MKTPYLNPQENPTAALYRLLNLLPEACPPITTPENAHIAQAICFHARRCAQALACAIATLRPLVAPAATPAHAVLQPIVGQLVLEANSAHAIAEAYQTLLERFYQHYPDLLEAARSLHTPIAPASLMAEYNKHYYFPLGKLLQQLPGDISNQTNLSQEQSNMCLAVSEYAERAHTTLTTGLALLAQLKTASLAEPLPNLDTLESFIDYLQAQADFMQECSADYGAAAQQG